MVNYWADVNCSNNGNTQMKSEIKIISDLIPFKVCQDLRVTCGLSPKSDNASRIGLKNSLHSIQVKLNEETIGMGRIVGDGGFFCQIVDICVHPNFQGKGFGKLIMAHLTKYIHHNLPKTCRISLIADGDASFLYEKYGFKSTLQIRKGCI